MTQCDIVVMDEIQKVVKFEMYIDAETQQAIQTGVAPWCSSPDYRCKGLDPDMFPSALGIGSTVPFKAWQSDHSKALDGFARAHRRGHVNGLPVFLIEAYMEESEFLALALAGDIMLNATMPGTASFIKPVNQQSFQSLVADVRYQTPEEAQEMLEGALRALFGEAQ